ncbi:recombinase family protein [Nguyenibacter vanlangensis]|uniref:Recombinase family protein n=1 Tax=Nguyenibacter vanlangensis TaxID=1216886 RepID=A0ABZ3D3C4_9PROT
MRYGYARVSTLKQSVGSQMPDLTAHGVEAENVFSDVGVSGSTNALDRPGFAAMVAMLNHGDEIVVTKIDRLGRSVADVLRTLDHLDSLGVEVLVIQLGGKISGPLGRLLRTVLAAVGEFERDLITERINAGLENARRHGTKSGKAIGRPRRSGRAVDLALRLVEQGHSHRDAAQIARISPSTLTRARQRDGIRAQVANGQIDLESAINRAKRAA